MKRKLLNFFLLLLLILCCSKNQWKEYNSAGGKYKVSYPGYPMVENQPVDTKLGKLYITEAILEYNDMAFITGYVDYPEDYVKKYTEKELLDSAAAHVRGKHLSESNVTFNNIKARELKAERTISNIDLILIFRFFMKGNRLYQIGVTLPKTTNADDDIKNFFDSFYLME